eukprot:TRINITY_DN10479_c0_g1_i4.p2 TRINITY_DN10479_c0_g1~~TRINITY_DN10479_c0_g1_i4.p2  ORF type:complete len:324 (-),score=82.98 TRINITY_DN10479_c0_g1_i4:156-1127(-)
MKDIQDEDLFEITGQEEGGKKRYPLDPERFKKKMWKYLGESKSEAKAVKKLVERIEKQKHKAEPKPEALYDLWDEPVKRPPKRKPQKSELPHVPIPHGGLSYNPSSAEYKDLLKKAAEFEKKKQEKDDKHKMKIIKTLAASKTAPVPEPEKESESESEVDITKISVNKPVDARKKKTRVKRNREKFLHAQELLKQKQKVEKTKIQDINKIKHYIKQQDLANEAAKKRGELKLERKREKAEKLKNGIIFGDKKIGKFKYIQHAVDFQLPDQLPKSLNELQLEEGSAIRNYYENVVKRGLYQPSTEDSRKGKRKGKHQFKFHEIN